MDKTKQIQVTFSSVYKLIEAVKTFPSLKYKTTPHRSSIDIFEGNKLVANALAEGNCLHVYNVKDIELAKQLLNKADLTYMSIYVR